MAPLRRFADIGHSLEKIAGDSIVLRVELPDELPEIKGDAAQIEQVLADLVMNARETMPDGGRITIRVDTTSIGYPSGDRPSVQPGDYVRIVVSDTGPGLDAVTSEHLFEPFFTTRQLGQGSGLVLASAYGIVKQSDGFIWVDSEAGVGTSFTILLPTFNDRTSTPARPLPSTGRTVLVVDDDETMRAQVAMSLKVRGYHVLDALSSARATEVFNAYNSRVHLLLAALTDGEDSGAALAARLTAIDPELHVLFMRGATLSEPEAPIAGRAIIDKPFTIEALAEKVRVVLEPDSAD